MIILNLETLYVKRKWFRKSSLIQVVKPLHGCRYVLSGFSDGCFYSIRLSLRQKRETELPTVTNQSGGYCKFCFGDS